MRRVISVVILAVIISKIIGVAKNEERIMREEIEAAYRELARSVEPPSESFGEFAGEADKK